MRLLAAIIAVLTLTPSFLLKIDAAEHKSRHVIFRSTDRGRSWSRSDAGIPGSARINAFTEMGGLILAGTDVGVFVSADDGRTWSIAEWSRENPIRVLCLARAGEKVFAGSDGGGLFVTADRGKIWKNVGSFSPRKVRSLLGVGDSVYAGTEEDGVFASHDAGESWRQLKPGLPPDSQVFALAAVKGELFAGLYSNGLYAWDEKHQHWLSKSNVVPLVLASAGDTLIAGHNPGGIRWSDDLGGTWTKALPNQSTPHVAIRIEPADGLSSEAPVWEMGAADDVQVAGAASGIFYSHDRGRTWTRARNGLPTESPGISFLVKKDLILAASIIKD